MIDLITKNLAPFTILINAQKEKTIKLFHHIPNAQWKEKKNTKLMQRTKKKKNKGQIFPSISTRPPYVLFIIHINPLVD
jgi:hypothetical protein